MTSSVFTEPLHYAWHASTTLTPWSVWRRRTCCAGGMKSDNFYVRRAPTQVRHPRKARRFGLVSSVQSRSRFLRFDRADLQHVVADVLRGRDGVPVPTTPRSRPRPRLSRPKGAVKKEQKHKGRRRKHRWHRQRRQERRRREKRRAKRAARCVGDARRSARGAADVYPRGTHSGGAGSGTYWRIIHATAARSSGGEDQASLSVAPAGFLAREGVSLSQERAEKGWARADAAVQDNVMVRRGGPQVTGAPARRGTWVRARSSSSVVKGHPRRSSGGARRVMSGAQHGHVLLQRSTGQLHPQNPSTALDTAVAAAMRFGACT